MSALRAFRDGIGRVNAAPMLVIGVTLVTLLVALPLSLALRGMLEAKQMLRDLWGTKNIYTYGVAGTGFSGLDCVLSLILPRDKVVCFPNGTFSGIDTLTIRMKAATKEESVQCIERALAKVLRGESRQGRRPQLWDGHAAERIVDVLQQELLPVSYARLTA